MPWVDSVKRGVSRSTDAGKRAADRAVREVRVRRIRRQIAAEQRRIGETVTSRIAAGDTLGQEIPEIMDAVARIGELSDQLAAVAAE